MTPSSGYTHPRMNPIARTSLPALLIAAFAAIGCDSPADADAAGPALASAADPAPLVWPEDGASADLFSEELLGLVNGWRVARGLNALADSAPLRAVALEHSSDMLRRGYFAHETPEGLTPSDRLNSAGVTWTAVGENLAGGWSLPQAVFEAWLSSAPHRANLEDERWTHAGAALSEDGSGGRAATLLFVRP
jgi:uncharacterized protein YkwD